MADVDASSLRVEWGSVIMNSASATSKPSPTDMVDHSADDPTIVVGRILWLPRLEELEKNAVQQVHPRADTGAEAYDHPVVVCSRPSRTRVHFHLITSFHGRSLEQRFGHVPATKADQKRIAWYLPIEPSPYHPRSLRNEHGLGAPRILLENGKLMARNSYINVHSVYAINRKYLRSYSCQAFGGATEHFLDQSSVQAMWAYSKRLTQYSPGPQYLVRQQRPWASYQPGMPRIVDRALERTETPQVVPIQPGRAEVGTNCPFLILLKAVGESPNTARQELISGRIPLGLALGLIAAVLWAFGVLLKCLHVILKFSYWGIRGAAHKIQGWCYFP
ncbi:hypothetical protein JOL62DRAFT_441332 [Phyllosticta paracitricarpa]|uniref:Uncharacterized protein n=1 Tax=Phyllosticta paracitricarpa TaxID=2016321 RepID=A0ABR1NC58_9PEZI